MGGFVVGLVVIGLGLTKISPSSLEKHLSLVLENTITSSNFAHRSVSRS